MLPDLQKELAFWVDKLRLGNWKIAIRYETDPRAPDTGAPVYGYCVRQLDIPSADIVIRTPASAADIAETHDTIVHELLHCRIANPEGSRVLEENAVWTLAPLLTELRLNAPAKAAVLCKALTRSKTLLAAHTRARAGGMDKMDPEQLATLAMEAGKLIAAGGLPPEVEKLFQQLISLAAGGSGDVAPPAPEEMPPPKEGDKPEDPPMGLQKQEPCMGSAAPAKVDAASLLAKIQTALGSAGGKDVQLKGLQEQLAADRAAAVDGLLDTRPDIKDKARTLLREIGVTHGVAKLREHMAEVMPKTEPKPAETLAKLGADKPIRGSNVTMAKASGDSKMDRLFRLMPDASEGNGFKISDRSDGKLCTASIVGALATVRAATQATVSRAKAKMGLGSEEAS